MHGHYGGDPAAPVGDVRDLTTDGSGIENLSEVGSQFSDTQFGFICHISKCTPMAARVHWRDRLSVLAYQSPPPETYHGGVVVPRRAPGVSGQNEERGPVV